MITQDNIGLPVYDSNLYTLTENKISPEALLGYTGNEDDTYGISTLIGEIGYVASIIRVLESEDDYSKIESIEETDVSFGAYCFSIQKGSIKAFLQNYINITQDATAQGFLDQFDGTNFNGNLDEFKTWLISIVGTTESIEAQDITFKDEYYDVIVSRTPNDITSFIVKVNIVDAYYNTGDSGIVDSLVFDSLIEVERLRIEYWKNTPDWESKELEYRNRLGQIRLILGVVSTGTEQNDILTVTDELLAKQRDFKLIELRRSNTLDPKVSTATLFNIDYVVELI